jgi:hypothetical protein
MRDSLHRRVPLLLLLLLYILVNCLYTLTHVAIVAGVAFLTSGSSLECNSLTVFVHDVNCLHCGIAMRGFRQEGYKKTPSCFGICN